jgi:hypothetical protein
VYTWLEKDEEIRVERPPVKAAPVLDAVAFARERLKFFGDELQEAVLASTAKRGILNCSRQWGKSTVVAIKAVHRAYTVPGCLVIVASPSERQSGEFIWKAAEFLAKLGIRRRGDGFNEMSLLLPNGSRIIGLPCSEATVRGFSGVSLMLIDEAALVNDAMYQALRPMLATSNGDLWLMSMPRAKRGFFYQTWVHGGERWFRLEAPATKCARIPAEFLEEEMEEMGEEMFRREYMCEFSASGLEVFGAELLAQAVDGEVKQLRL